MNEITLSELDQLEAVVRNGLQSFMAVGMALIEIRESKGYRLRGYNSFKEYCSDVFGFTARHGRRMINAAQTARAIAQVTGEEPRNENVARTLEIVAGDPAALRLVKKRLMVRGQSMGKATGALVESILQNVQITKPRPTLHKATERAGRCPACGELPAAYKRIQEIGFECSTCKARVILKVTAMASSDQCPRCSMRFSEENPRFGDKGFCTYCAEEVNLGTRQPSPP